MIGTMPDYENGEKPTNVFVRRSRLPNTERCSDERHTSKNVYGGNTPAMRYSVFWDEVPGEGGVHRGVEAVLWLRDIFPRVLRYRTGDNSASITAQKTCGSSAIDKRKNVRRTHRPVGRFRRVYFFCLT